MSEDSIEHIKKTLHDLNKFCQEQGLKCSFGFGGGWCYDGGLVLVNENGVDEIEPPKKTREYSCLSFRVIIKDTDYGQEVNPIKDSIQNMFDQFPKGEDFDAIEDQR